MRINWKIVSGVLAAMFVYDEVNGVITEKRLRTLKTQLTTEKKLSGDLYSHVSYLARQCDEHKIPRETFEIGLISDFEKRMGY